MRMNSNILGTRIHCRYWHAFSISSWGRLLEALPVLTEHCWGPKTLGDDAFGLILFPEDGDLLSEYVLFVSSELVAENKSKR